MAREKKKHGINSSRSKKQSSETDEISVADLLGIRGIRSGIIMTDNGYTLPIEVMPVNFKLKSSNEQDFIIKSYEELLKIVKVPFQIFTIAKRADSKVHMELMDKYLETETNEHVRTMIKEYKEFVTAVSYKNAVKKRFIIAIPYAVPPDTKFEAILFKDAAAWLFEKRAQFVNALEKCGNEVVIPELADTDQFTAQILYELLNVKASETQKMVRLNV